MQFPKRQLPKGQIRPSEAPQTANEAEYCDQNGLEGLGLHQEEARGLSAVTRTEFYCYENFWEVTTWEITPGKLPLGKLPLRSCRLGKCLPSFSMLYLERQRTAVTLKIPGMLAGKFARKLLMISLLNWLVDQTSSMKMPLFSPFLMYIWVS